MQRLTLFFLLSCVLLLAACGESPNSETAPEAAETSSEPAQASDDAQPAETAEQPDANAETDSNAAQGEVDSDSYASFGEGGDFNACEPEVIEVFAYTCIHCYRFEEFLQPWSESAEERGIRLERKAMPGNKAMTTWARVHAALKQMGQADAVHHDLFEKLHGDGEDRIESMDDLLVFIDEQGVDSEAFRAVLESEALTEVLQNDYALMQAAGVRATPTLLVNRQYKLEPSGGQGFQNMLATVDQLVERDRQAADCE